MCILIPTTFILGGIYDWHNAEKTENPQIKNYTRNEMLFGDKIWQNIKWKNIVLQEKNAVMIKIYV